MDADASEGILQMVCTLLQVGTGSHGHHKVEMAVDQLLVLTGYQLLDLLDVLHGNLIAGIRE